jgi:arylformamidase
VIIDITRPIAPGMLLYPGDPSVAVTPVSLAGEGEAAVSALHLGTHTGTHVDPPAHLLPGGATVDQLDLAMLVGPAHVVHLSGSGMITPDALAAVVPLGCTRLLLRTHAGELWQDRAPTAGYRGLSAAAAEWLVAAGVRLVGIDYLSVDAAEALELPVHRTLLTAGVVIVECLDLTMVAAGEYTLMCLPLRLIGGDGAPARAVLAR